MTQNPASAIRLNEREHDGWSGRLVWWVAILIVANTLVDTVIVAPLLVLPQMAEFFGTDQSAWLNASAVLAGAMWAPLLGKSADIYGKRRVLVLALLAGGVGALICLVAPNIGIFLLGRVIQGTAVGSVFITVVYIRQMFPTRVGMTSVGIVTSGSAILGIASPFLFEAVVKAFDFRAVFVVSATLAFVAAISVRVFLPESPVHARSRLDVLGAILLGLGLAGVLAYISLGPTAGWTNAGLVVILLIGVTLLTAWVFSALRTPQPVVDLRRLTRPMVAMLLVVVLGTGAYQALLQLMGLIGQTPPEAGLGYGLAGESSSLGFMFALPALGAAIGGIFAGWLGARIGPARTLAGGAFIGLGSGFGLLLSTGSFLPAAICAGLLGLTAGALVTSGFNLATTLVPEERQGVVASLVQVMLGVGSVVMNIVGGSILSATTIPDSSGPSAAGVNMYIIVMLGAFAVATAIAVGLSRHIRWTTRTDSSH
ncbi:MFS transporter [Microbacterium galbinum]|uniref:MFS transporter n=1 Tax=Microbacterium galbinum TaxID=2851646 RepID=A0ABY4IQ58_9MICO|nr:MFS transporter [Microbacterium galbinum]UPL14784.1 MFS transporter [Microbacterium galbinum]